MTDIFLSYKREDRTHAKTIAGFLVAEGYEVWWDIELLPGDQFADEINAVLKSARAVVVLWTPEATKSSWVKSEAMVGLRRKKLIPVMLRQSELPVPFNSLQTLDLTAWSQEPNKAELKPLLSAVERRLGDERPRPNLAPQEVGRQLKKPEYEVEFWTSISSSFPGKVEEYELYLERYGENGSFSQLAKRRIVSIRRRERRLLPKLRVLLAILGTVVGIGVGVLTIAQMLKAFEELPDENGKVPPSTLEEQEVHLACSYIDIKALGWKDGHKTDFCVANGYDKGNFNQGEYRDGGICLRGPEPDTCIAAFRGHLGPEIDCRQNGSLTECYRTAD